MTSLTVFTAANRKYEPFVLPFAASVLTHNPEAVAEIALEDAEAFKAENTTAMEVLERHLGPRLHVRNGSFAGLTPNSVRFLETPERAAEHVYIGDIDILVLEPIAPFHLAQMAKTGRPYSNIKRPGKERLSGLHFSRWDAYYPRPDIPRTMINHDEFYLYQLVAARGHELPDESESVRPLHGFHLSLNIDPRMTHGWGGTRNPKLASAYSALRTGPMWQELVPHLDERFRRLLFVLDVLMVGRFPKIFDAAPLPDDTRARFVFG